MKAKGIQNIDIHCHKKETHTGLEQHHVKKTMTIFMFFMKYSFNTVCVVQVIYDLSEEFDEESDSSLS